MKKLFSLLLALMLVFSMTVPALAATSGTLTINGAQRKKDETGKTYYEIDVDCTPGSEYHEYDLFGDSFKNMMPGDTATAQIVINANFKLFSEDSIRVWIEGAPSNPLHYDEDYEETDGKDQPPVTGNRDETVASNRDFLSKLTLTIKNPKTGKTYYSGPADGTYKIGDRKTATDDVLTFRARGQITLEVSVHMPIELDNTYANRVGEIDWALKISAYDDPAVDNPKTGDYIMMAVAVMAVSAAVLVILFAVKRKKKNRK